MMYQEVCRYVVTTCPPELISETSPISEISCFPPLVLPSVPPPLGAISLTSDSLSVKHGACGRVQEDE